MPVWSGLSQKIASKRIGLRLNLGQKFSLSIVVSLLLLFTGTAFLALYTQNKAFTNFMNTTGAAFEALKEAETVEFKKDEVAKVEQLGKMLVQIAPAAIASFDLSALETYVKTAVEDPSISYAAYYDEKNNLLSSAGDLKDVPEENKKKYDIAVSGKSIGSAVIGYNHSFVERYITLLTDETRKALETLGVEKASAIVSVSSWLIGGLTVTALLVVGLVLVLFRMLISRPVSRSIGVMNTLAEGQYDVDVPYSERHDEIGDIAKALIVFKNSGQERAELALREKHENEEKIKRAEKIDQAIREFEGMAAVSLQDLIGASDRMKQTSASIQGLVEDTRLRSTSVASAAEQANANVSTVASASEELSASINEIKRQIERTKGVADASQASTLETSAIMKELAVAVEGISNVVGFINDIAEQTNLLALNATIESARAGEAGKGFAVVANEVKTLAGETQKATEDIAAKISDIQQRSGKAITAVASVEESVAAVREISEQVFDAMNEQAAATQEIARNVIEASTGTEEVSRNIQEVSSAANLSGQGAAELLDVAAKLADNAEAMKRGIQDFLERIKTA